MENLENTGVKYAESLKYSKDTCMVPCDEDCDNCSMIERVSSPSYHEIHGDIFTSNAEALVNTVNCVGVMGKGIALEFKRRYPDLFSAYRKACYRRELSPGKVWTYRTKSNRIIFNVAVKDDWRNPSKIEWVESCLTEIVRLCRANHVKSLALPRMGAMNGWIPVEQIQASTRRILSKILDIDISVYEIRDLAMNKKEAPASSPSFKNHGQGRSVEVYDYVQSGDKMKRVVAGHALLISLEREEFQTRTIFPEKFPVPVVCSEFCGKVDRCNLRENGFSDLCRHNHLLGTLVKKPSGKFRRPAREEGAPVIWAKSTSRSVWLDDHESNWKTDLFGNYSHYTDPRLVPHTALVHERTEDSTFAAYSSQEFLDTCDDPEEGCELEYTMDTGMVSQEKSQEGVIPSFMYRTVYRDRRVLIGFETRMVEKTYVETERRWINYLPYGRFIQGTRKVVRTTTYRDDVPVYRWIRLPTLRPIGCYLKPMKIIGSTTIMTRREQRFYKDRREVERQNRRHEKVLILQDGIDARKQVAPAAC